MRQNLTLAEGVFVFVTHREPGAARGRAAGTQWRGGIRATGHLLGRQPASGTEIAARGPEAASAAVTRRGGMGGSGGRAQGVGRRERTGTEPRSPAGGGERREQRAARTPRPRSSRYCCRGCGSRPAACLFQAGSRGPAPTSARAPARCAAGVGLAQVAARCRDHPGPRPPSPPRSLFAARLLPRRRRRFRRLPVLAAGSAAPEPPAGEGAAAPGCACGCGADY